jgi:hypothetical protein
MTEPLEKYGEWRCYIRDVIEVGQSTTLACG